MSPVALRTSVLLVLSALLMFGASCEPSGESPVEPVTTAVAPTTTSSPTTTLLRTTTSEAKPVFRFTKVEPRTLKPVPGLEPLDTGDTHGLVSLNGRWLVLESWGEGRWLIDTVSWELVSDFRPWGHLMAVRDDGAVYAVDWDPMVVIKRFAPGATEWEEMLAVDPGVNLWSEPVFIGEDLLAGRGFSEEASVDGDLTVNTFDMTAGTWRQIAVPGAWVPGEPTGIVVDSYEITSHYEPAVAFTQEKAFVVHAHEDVITEVELDTGKLVRHDFGAPTSMLDALLAWANPRALAKGPEAGVRRTAVVNPGGSKLYVGGYHSDVSLVEGEVREATEPLGIMVIDTEEWRVEKILDLPVGTVNLSPDGSMLLAAGYSESTVFAISTDTYQVTPFDTSENEWTISIEFSPDSAYAYLQHDFRVEVLDLKRVEIVGEMRRTRPIHLWGASAVVSEWLGQHP